MAEKDAERVVDRYYASIMSSHPPAMKSTNQLRTYEMRSPLEESEEPQGDPWVSDAFYTAPVTLQQIKQGLEHSRHTESRAKDAQGMQSFRVFQADLSEVVEENVMQAWPENELEFTRETIMRSFNSRMNFGSRGAAEAFSTKQGATSKRLLQEMEAECMAHTPQELDALCNTAALFDAIGDLDARPRIKTLFSEYQINPNLKMPFGNHSTPLAHAALHGDVDAVDTLLEHRADPSLRCGVNCDGLLPLEVAFKQNHVEVCNLLIRENQDVNWLPPMKEAGDHWDFLFSSLTGRLPTLKSTTHYAADVAGMTAKVRGHAGNEV